ncbi:MAG: peptidylprolyl isomerase [Flavobacteriales bacterium]|nr:peptidylprolyl isomerase [Flavobacteriales bacterium]
MKIETGKHVKLNYQLFINDTTGEMVEETTTEQPFEFNFKTDELLPSFENAIEGLAAGEKFSVTIESKDAYGEAREDLVIEFPKDTFMGEEGIDEEVIAEGEVVPMQDQDGNELFGLVLENKLNSVVLDFNHPLAGETLHFEGNVIEVA